MSFNTILIQFVFFSCLLILLRARQMPRGWVFLAGAILLALAGAYLWLPHWAGWISGSLWLGLLILPLLGVARVNRLVSQERYGAARRLANWVRWLHPMDGLMSYPTLLRGLELGQQGHMDEAIALFKRCGTATTNNGRMSTALLYQLDARWPELLAWVKTQPTQTVFDQGAVGIFYLRSLGETGDLNSLLHEFERFERKLERGNDVTTLNLIRMYALAFCGYPAAVERLFQESLTRYSANIRQFWVATAALVAGDAFAREQLLALRDRSDRVKQAAIDWRLSQPLAVPAQVLTDSSWQILDRLQRTMHQEALYGNHTAFKQSRAYATYALIALNVAVFGLEINWGGSEDAETLIRMGALVPELTVTGEWWRLLAATFLHFGPLHLLFNMLGLYVFGTLVESRLSTVRFLLAYLFSGVGSMLVAALLAIVTDAPQVSVGASGAIMGLVGGLGAIALKGWRQDKAKIAAKQLRAILLIAGLQVLSDLVTPQVSLVGHASGLILGFIAVSVLYRPRPSVAQTA